MDTSVNPVQPENADFPIEVTELGIATEVKPLRPLNAYPGIVFTSFPIFIVFRFVQLLNGDNPISAQFSALKFTSVKPVQPKNAQSPISVTELGIVTEVKPVQPENA